MPRWRTCGGGGRTVSTPFVVRVRARWRALPVPFLFFFIVHSGVQEGGGVRWGECSPHDEAFGCDVAAHAAATHAPAADGRVPFFNRPKSTDSNQCPPPTPLPPPLPPPPWHQCRPARRDDERLFPPPTARGGGVSPR